MKKPKIVIDYAGDYRSKTGLRWWYILTGGNNKIFCTSETFTRKSDAMRSLKRLCETFGIVDFELSDKTGDK